MIYETLIVSDVHLGSPWSMAEELYDLLDRTEFKRLILLGDIFSDLNFSRLTSAHWKLVSLIRKLANPKRGVEVIWVEGNHDRGITKVMEHLLGVKVYDRYVWEWDGHTCLAVHGHQFDAVFAKGDPWFNDLLTHSYIALQKVSWIRNWLPGLVDRFCTEYQRLGDKVAAGAMAEARKIGAHFVFCGHTHCAERRTEHGVAYLNTGSWMGFDGSYVMISDPKDGGVQLKTGPGQYMPLYSFEEYMQKVRTGQ